MKLKKLFLFLNMLLFAMPLFAQMQQAPAWKVSISKPNVKETVLSFKAAVPSGWYMYANDFDPDLGPMLTEFRFEENETYELAGELQPVGQHKKYDSLWQGEITYFTDTAEFRQRVRLLKEKPVFSGTISYQVCSDESGQCIPFESDFNFRQGGPIMQEAKAAGKQERRQAKESRKGEKAAFQPTVLNEGSGGAESVPLLTLEPFEGSFAAQKPQEGSWSSWLGFFLLSFGAGLTALLTPCVFPMIPMTVTYFTRTSGRPAKKALCRRSFTVFPLW